VGLSRGAALDYSEKVFGGPVRDITNTFNVAAAVQEVAGGDADRVFVLFVNLGANQIWIHNRADVSTTNGIRVAPSGGVVGFTVLQDGILSALPWYAYGVIGGSTLYVMQVRRESITKPAESGA